MAIIAKGAARDRDLWKRLVNDKWNGQQPVLSGEESIRAAKRLYRKAMGKPWTGPVKLTSGNRHTWVYRGVLKVNPDRQAGSSRGLREIIHAISHYAHARKNPHDAPHSSRQAYLERDLVDYAIKYGFADGALVPRRKVEPVAKPDKIRQRYQSMVRRRDKWKAEAERAARLLKKAEQEVRQYEKRHGQRLA